MKFEIDLHDPSGVLSSIGAKRLAEIIGRHLGRMVDPSTGKPIPCPRITVNHTSQKERDSSDDNGS